MIGIGLMELAILLGMALFALAGIAVLYFVVRAAAQSGSRDFRDGPG